MIIIYNNIIPFKGFKAINLFGVLFVRKGYKLNDIDIRHERIHTAQQREMLYVFFFLWYVIDMANTTSSVSQRTQGIQKHQS